MLLYVLVTLIPFSVQVSPSPMLFLFQPFFLGLGIPRSGFRRHGNLISVTKSGPIAFSFLSLFFLFFFIMLMSHGRLHLKRSCDEFGRDVHGPTPEGLTVSVGLDDTLKVGT